MKKLTSQQLKNVKESKKNIHFIKRFLALIMVFCIIFQMLELNNFSYAASVTKTKTITLSSTTRNTSKTVNIPSLKNITNIKINNGKVMYSKSENNVTINASNGTATKVQTGGSYIPSKTKYIDNWDSSYYNQQGYTGTLQRYVASGYYTASRSKSVTEKKTDKGYVKWVCGAPGIWVKGKSSIPSGASYIHYNSGGYKGKIYKSNTKIISGSDPNTEPSKYPLSSGQTKYKYATYEFAYSGTVKTDSVDTRVYKYKGSVTKPSEDTRTYEDRYIYTVTIEYIDNVFPTVINKISNKEVKVGNELEIELSSVFSDDDGDTLKLTSDKGNIENNVFRYIPSKQDEGKTVEVTITANDGKGGETINSFNINVKKNNIAPIVLNKISDQEGSAGEEILLDISSVFKDADNDELTLNTNKGEMDGLTFKYTPTEEDEGKVISVTITATDNKGGEISDSFKIHVLENELVQMSIEEVNNSDEYTIIDSLFMLSDMSENFDVTTINLENAEAYVKDFAENETDTVAKIQERVNAVNESVEKNVQK